MAMWRHSDRIYSDVEDIKAAANIAARRITEQDVGSFEQGVYCGIHFTLNAMLNHDRMDMAPTFYALLENYMDGAYDIDGMGIEGTD